MVTGQSIDFDFFTSTKMDLKKMALDLPYIKNNPHSMQVRSSNYIVSVNNKNVNITFLNDKNIIAGVIKNPSVTTDNGIKIALPIDLMACKILAFHNRTEVKDFIDLGELIKNKNSL